MYGLVFVGQRNAEKSITPCPDRIEKILFVHKINSISHCYKTNGRKGSSLIDLHFEIIGFNLCWWETNFVQVVCFRHIQKDDSVLNAFVDWINLGCVGVGPWKPWFAGMFTQRANRPGKALDNRSWPRPENLPFDTPCA